jgi:hypothetical protein
VRSKPRHPSAEVGSKPAKLQTYSIRELAKLWQWSESDVADLLCQRDVSVYVYGKRIMAAAIRWGRQKTFRGYVRLTSDSAQQILADGTSGEIIIDDGGPFGEAPFRVISPVIWNVSDLRVMRRDVDALGRAKATSEESISVTPPVERITIGQVATRYKNSESTVRRWIKRGLPVRRASQNSLLGNWDEIEQWVKKTSTS